MRALLLIRSGRAFISHFDSLGGRKRGKLRVDKYLSNDKIKRALMRTYTQLTQDQSTEADDE